MNLGLNLDVSIKLEKSYSIEGYFQKRHDSRRNPTADTPDVKPPRDRTLSTPVPLSSQPGNQWPHRQLALESRNSVKKVGEGRKHRPQPRLSPLQQVQGESRPRCLYDLKL